jgi:hypothetical protein
MKSFKKTEERCVTSSLQDRGKMQTSLKTEERFSILNKVRKNNNYLVSW